MNIQRATPVNEWLAKVIFLLVPTGLAGYFLLLNLNQYYTVLRSQELKQTLYFTSGMGVAALLYAFRFRFLPVFLLLVAGLYFIYKGLDTFVLGEFDYFFILAQFRAFSIVFVTGWLIGWGFIRSRYWAIVIAAMILCGCILMIAKMKPESVETWADIARYFKSDSAYALMYAFSPAALYAVYIVFTAEQIYSYKDKSQSFWWYLTRRMGAFLLVASLVLGTIIYFMKDEIKETLANFGGGGKDGDNSMLKQNKDGTFDLKDYAQLRSSLGRSNQLLFCAHIDNFFDGTDIPNPLYLTAFYYTKFDTLTETFERDSLIPNNDLFEPDLSKVPLFGTITDSSVIRNSLSGMLRKTVEIQVYNKNLNPSTFLSPNTGFFVQPITVEKDFRDSFRSAFRAKSYVSELNSAYFVYNSDNAQIRQFQEKRFEVMRKFTDYSGLSPEFMRYYTFMPSDEKFKRISDLAHKVTAKAKTPVDKVIAIRDYFLSKDENGDPLFKYTDNPGIPDIPSASKLMYFLFENRQGYCAYYAGATLFMLRALGIPSRITVGFLTEDRSDKNKGWYWYYANQAHAWVQVYFPGLGWLDFDTTVGNSDARQSPQTDGTPPMQPPKAWLSATGIIRSVDTGKKMAILEIKEMVFKDKEYKLQPPKTINMDLHIAAIRRDSMDIPLSTMQPGDEATVVSYAEAFRKLQPGEEEQATGLITRFPDPVPIDEVYLKRKEVKKQEEKPQPPKEEPQKSWEAVLWAAGSAIISLFLLFFLMPRLVLGYYLIRHTFAKKAKARTYWAYRTATYYLHQVGIFRRQRTPMQYARQLIEPLMGPAFTSFMNLYLKQKYAAQELTPAEEQQATGFLMPFLKAVRKAVPFKRRVAGFLSPLRTISYFAQAESEKKSEM